MQLSLGLNFLGAPGTSISDSAAFGLTEPLRADVAERLREEFPEASRG